MFPVLEKRGELKPIAMRDREHRVYHQYYRLTDWQHSWYKKRMEVARQTGQSPPYRFESWKDKHACVMLAPGNPMGDGTVQRIGGHFNSRDKPEENLLDMCRCRSLKQAIVLWLKPGVCQSHECRQSATIEF